MQARIKRLEASAGWVRVVVGKRLGMRKFGKGVWRRMTVGAEASWLRCPMGWPCEAGPGALGGRAIGGGGRRESPRGPER